jgi:hypothetical protein
MFLDQYGEGDARRERVFKALVALLLIALALGLIYYVFFRTWAEQRQAGLFLSALEEGRYEQAYEYWGCTVSEPCRYYPYEKFLADWGSDSELGPVKSYDLSSWHEQKTGVIIKVTINGQSQVNLWVEKDNKRVGFSPY